MKLPTTLFVTDFFWSSIAYFINSIDSLPTELKFLSCFLITFYHQLEKNTHDLSHDSKETIKDIANSYLYKLMFIRIENNNVSLGI